MFPKFIEEIKIFFKMYYIIFTFLNNVKLAGRWKKKKQKQNTGSLIDLRTAHVTRWGQRNPGKGKLTK